MKQTVGRWQCFGFIFTGALGTFLHFLFDLTGGNIGAALFSAVNESIWEHTKLIFYPMLLFAFIEYRRWGKDLSHFWCVKLRGILLGLILIPVLYYSYTGILGTSADWFNIAIFFIVAGIVYWRETQLLLRESARTCKPLIALGILGLMAVVFTMLTFFPPQIPLFQDPLTGTYGYQSPR